MAKKKSKKKINVKSKPKSKKGKKITNGKEKNEESMLERLYSLWNEKR
jgi:hypothetical protein